MKESMRIIKHIFIQGPSWMGCWSGVQNHDICAQSTKTDSSMWLSSAIECQNLIDRLFNSWKIGVYVPIVLFVGLWTMYVVNNSVKHVLKKPKQTNIIIHKDSLKFVSPKRIELIQQ